VNSKSNDLTVIDVQKATIANILNFSGIPMMLSRHVLAILSHGGVHLIDAGSNQVIDEYDMATVRNLTLTPDGEFAVLLRNEDLLCLDTRSGKLVSQSSNFEAARDLVITETLH
jgi:hypothetical protein